MKPITLAEARSLALSATRAVEEGLRADRAEGRQAMKAEERNRLDTLLVEYAKTRDIALLRRVVEDIFDHGDEGMAYLSDLANGREISDSVVPKIMEVK